MAGQALRGRLGLGVLAAAALLAAGTARTRAAAPGPDDTRAFVEQAEGRLLELGNRLQRAQWVMSTYITQDTEQLAADANREYIAATMELAKQAKRFDGQKLPDDVARRLLLLKLSLPMPAPADPKLQAELTDTAAWLEGSYGRGKYCPDGQGLPRHQRHRAGSWPRAATRRSCSTSGAAGTRSRRRCARATRASSSWRTRARATSASPTRGALWRSNYDMPPDGLREGGRPAVGAGAAALPRAARLRARPAVGEVRARRRAARRADPGAPARQHVGAELGQHLPAGRRRRRADPGYDLTALLKAKKVDAREMVRYGEGFFTSLGFEPLPKTFWERSLFTKPADRDVVCHASAWDVDNEQDLRIKMCIEIERGGLRHHPPRARAQLLPARLPPPAVPLPQRRERRLPRGDRRRDRALGHARPT